MSPCWQTAVWQKKISIDSVTFQDNRVPLEICNGEELGFKWILWTELGISKTSKHEKQDSEKEIQEKFVIQGVPILRTYKTKGIYYGRQIFSSRGNIFIYIHGRKRAFKEIINNVKSYWIEVEDHSIGEVID